MSRTLGQSILVETVTGAGATIGVGRVVGAPPDGYMLSIGNWSSHVGSPAIYPVSWNPVNDLDPIVRLPVSSLMIVGKEVAAGQQRQGADRLAQGQARARDRSQRRRGLRRPCLRALLRAEDRDQAAIRVLSRRRAGDAGHAGRHHRHHVRRGVADAGACDGAQDESLRRDGADALRRAARGADHGGDGNLRHGHLVLARAVGAEGHAEGRRRQAQRRGRQGARRSGRAKARRRRSA